MLNRRIFSAGILLLLVFCSSAFAQTQIKKNSSSAADSIVVELPHKTKMILVLDDINKLQLVEKTSLDSLVRTLNKQLQENGTVNPSNASAASLPDQTNSEAATDTTKSKPSDQLVIWGSVGAGLIRQEWVPQLSPGLELWIKDKSYFVHYDMNFFFDRTPERKYKMYLNSFLEVGFGFKKFSTDGTKDTKQQSEHFRRISVGYLVQSNGGYFEKNTFRLSYSYPILNNLVKIMPQVYFTNNFKTVFPGVSIRF